jgi:hypothetical protein
MIAGRKSILKSNSFYHLILYMVFFLSLGPGLAYAQSTDSVKLYTPADSTLGITADSITIDSALYKSIKPTDSAAIDSLKKRRFEDSLGIKISKDALQSVVNATSRDSAVLDMHKNLFYLYGKAQVKYEDKQLDAGKIVYEQNSNTVKALPAVDSVGIAYERPSFMQGKETFTYDSMQYNFKSKRAIIRNVRTKYGEGYMFSKQIKRNPDQSVYGFRSVYTTCALDTPHFGIVARKIKVIPGHIIATGSANIAIEGVPTPLFLPFGLFPSSDKQKSGFVIPTYTIEQSRGLGLTNGGYYFYLNDHADLLMQTDLFTKGSYRISTTTNYSDIYEYRGLFRFSYAMNKTGENFEPGATITKDFNLTWSHTTDAKAKPGEVFNVSVNAGTSTYYSNNSYDANQILQNQMSSNISFSKNWIGTPFSLTISALHSQNTRTRQVNVTLPSMSFHVNQFNPFQRKRAVGTHWYDKITTSYSMNMMNRTTFYDSALNLAKLDMKQFQNGIQHAIPISASYNVLRYIVMSFNINYNEYWYSRRVYQGFDMSRNMIDTTLDQQGFYAARDFNAGVNFSTRIYGMKMFKTGKLMGIRHVIYPSVGLTYRPDFSDAPFNYYYKAQIDSYHYSMLSPYQGSGIGVPPSGKQGLVSFALNNNLQIKVRSSKDTLTGTKNITLIDGFNIATGYNAAVDSFQWSDISMTFRTNILDKISISGSSRYDAYALDYTTGQRIDRTMIDQGTGFGRFKSASLALGSNFHSAPLNSANNPTNSEEYTRVLRNAGYNDYVNFNIPWSFNISYTMDYSRNWSYWSHLDTNIISHNATFSGEFNLTERWKVSFLSSYNFTLHQLGMTQLDIYRDLHCWQMHFSTIPFGARKSYTFTLNVKATVLQDLKLVRRRDYRDAAQ